MKKTLIVLVVMVLVAMVGQAMAADSATITVTATVQGTCKFTPVGAAATLAFGTLTPGPAAADVTGSTTIDFWCTKGVTLGPTWTVGAVALPYDGTMTGAVSTDPLDYRITSIAVAGVPAGPGTPLTATVNGTVFANSVNGYNVASEDTYSGTFVLELNP